MAIPVPRLHKATGQAYVYYKGKMIYLGKYGTKKAEDGYWAWRATLGKRVAEGFKVNELIERYEKENKLFTNDKHFMAAFKRELVQFFSLPCDDFGPLALRETRKMLASTGTRTADTVNAMTRTLLRAFRWGVSVQVVTLGTWQALDTVPSLKAHEVARKGKGRGAVPQEIVDATMPHLYLHIQHAVTIQLMTGARPSEVLSIKKSRIEKTGAHGTWIYRPEHHKTEGKGKTRFLLLGPKAQAAFIEQAALHPNTDWLFPSDAKDGHLTPNGYKKAVEAGAKLAGVPHWTTYQLRHLRLTQITTDHGLEVAAKVAGHSGTQMTQGYSHEPDAQQFRDAG